MKPIEFPGCNVVLGRGQSRYQELPARSDGNCVSSCWKLTWKERLKILFTGKLWLAQLTFGHRFQPQAPSLTDDYKP
jgi:hypothetical protein